MSGRILFAVVFASFLGGHLFLVHQSRDDGLIGGLAPVDQLYLGFIFIFLTGCVVGGMIMMAVSAIRAARRKQGGNDG